MTIMSVSLELTLTGNPASACTPVAQAAARPAERTGSGRLPRAARRCLHAMSTTALVLAVAAFVLLAVGPRLFGYQTSTMLTGSMAPLINPGDVVVTVPVPVKDVKVGDIITYHIPVEDQRVETHRITEITTTATGHTAVQTKGDANNGKDPWVATLAGQTVDRHVLTIPYLGAAIHALREPAVRNTLMYGAPAVLVLGLLTSIWRKDPNPKTQDTHGAAAGTTPGEARHA
jgi:signal peptidase